MKKRGIFLIIALALAAGLTASAGEGEAADHVDWFGVLGKVFNSTVLFGGLILLLRKPLIQMLSQKSSAIEKDIKEREKNLADTSVRLQDIQQRLTKVAAEVAAMKTEAEAVGKDELSRLEKAGQLEAERIVALSEEEIRQRVDAAVRAVKGRIADLAIERFKNDFSRSLDDATQQKIVERNIDSCGDLSRDGAGRPIGGLHEGK
jgi:F0F1-type ATP synthase membrane subunit b/b'